jgi:hypothetical protein
MFLSERNPTAEACNPSHEDVRGVGRSYSSFTQHGEVTKGRLIELNIAVCDIVVLGPIILKALVGNKEHTGSDAREWSSWHFESGEISAT